MHTPATSTPVVRTERLSLVSIDILRGVAALWVATYHAYKFFWRPALPPIHFDSPLAVLDALLRVTIGEGQLAVPLFFVLSGFCIHLPYARRDKLALREYGARRLLRIWPPYAAAVLLGIAMAVVRDHHLDLFNTVAHFFFWIWSTHPFAKDDVGMNPVFWTIVIEVQLYFLYAVLWRTIRRFGLKQITIAFLVAGLTYHIAGEIVSRSLVADGRFVPNILLPRVFALARFGEWLLGAWVADLLVNRSPQAKASRPPIARWALTGVAIVIAARLVAHGLDLDFSTPETLYSIGLAYIVAALAFGEQRQQSVDGEDVRVGPVAGFFGAIGLRCYSLYLLHFAVIAIVGELGARLMHLSDADKDALGGSSRWLIVTLCTFPAMAIATELCYRLVEVPSHRLARRVAQGLRDPA